jgi:hypothetical protein
VFNGVFRSIPEGIVLTIPLNAMALFL